MNKKSLVFTLMFGLLTIVYLTLRLNDFKEKMTFYSDQGLHLLESYEMIEEGKLRLIGPEFTSKTYLKRGFFGGPQYYYTLAITGKIFNWDPVKMTLFIGLVEFGILIYFIFWIKKKYGLVEALVIFSLIAMSKYLIIHSRFIWNPHFLLPLGLLGYIAFDNYLKKKKWGYLALFSFLWGIAFGFHFAAALWIIPILIILWKNKKLFNLQIFLIPIFFILGDLPYFAFELRHNFYNIKTLIMALIVDKNGRNMELHYFINPFLPYFLISTAFLINKFKLLKIKIFIGAMGILFISLTQIFLIKESIPIGHPAGWNYPLEKIIVDKILRNGCPKDFNIASTIGGDTRSYDLRFLLATKNCPPMRVEDYPNAKKIFLIASPDRPPDKESVWEVTSLGRLEIKEKIIYNPNVIYYELEK